MNPESVVVLKWPQGYVAYIRYSDSQYDRNISHSYRSVLQTEVERYVKDVRDSV